MAEKIVWRSENADHPYHGGHRVVREGRGARPPRFNLQRRERGRRQWRHVNGFHWLPDAIGYAEGQA